MKIKRNFIVIPEVAANGHGMARAELYRSHDDALAYAKRSDAASVIYQACTLVTRSHPPIETLYIDDDGIVT